MAQLFFAILVAATGAAFFVTQRLKLAPRAVRTLTVTRAISPRVPYRRASIRIRLTRPDRATVTIIDAGGDVVRRLVTDRPFRPDQRVELLWNGRDTRGRVVPDGEYRVRVSLRRQGRSVVLLDTITVDGTPPRPLVRVQRQRGSAGPLLAPPRGGAPVRFRVTGTDLRTERLFILRTDRGRPRVVTRLRSRRSPTAEGTWDGRIGRRPAPPGTYVVVARDTDAVGNSAYSFPFTRPHQGDPPGGAGVTVRYLASQGPQAATPAARLFTVFVDARGRQYRWRLHRLDQARTIAHGASRNPALRLHAPRGPSGVYVVELASGGHHAAALVPVQGPGRHRVLVVLPVISWQGRNRVDDDGDGLVDTLDRNGRARLSRPLAGGGVPPGFAANEAPLLRLLDRPQQRYDITTDLALAGPAAGRLLRGHHGVVLAGIPRWLPADVGTALRRFVSAGGRLFSPGTDALRRTAQVSGGELTHPSPGSTADVFGSTLAPIAHRGVELLAGQDHIGLFKGGDGLFRGFGAFEETLAPGAGARVISAAEEQGARAGAPVIVAVALGRGLVIRTGLPQWGARLGRDPNVAALTKRTWVLLSH
ncbi:MAG: FlgD immunoglobulin-like domain containing protein [Solirubrobacteraceae bacterium]